MASSSKSTKLNEKITFTVDSALLRELGERLVGQPHIALAELVKNSYDADATEVTIRISEDTIEVLDNGLGMSFSDFQDHWMRIGSPHKQREQFSKRFERPITGSKGVGRLAVQFLSRRLELTTTAFRSAKEIRAQINWDEAIKFSELTEVVARYGIFERQTEYPEDSKHGTAITLRDLNQDWDTKALTNLAQEIWMLQPPFRTSSKKRKASGEFKVELQSDDPEVTREFDEQMEAHLSLWNARMVGNLIRRRSGDADVQLVLEYSDGERLKQTFKIKDCALADADFEIRIFRWEGRQPAGIRVSIARDYFNRYGGVHVYDSGFHLPYYGADHDWLDIEKTHSHRVSVSKLLPEEFNINRGMNFLPTQSRIWGVVNVDTKSERDKNIALDPHRTNYLQIQVTRDRLVPNRAYEDLRNAVRWALDFYAVTTAKRRAIERERERPVEKTSEKAKHVTEVLDTYKAEISEDIFDELKDDIEDILETAKSEAEELNEQLGLLGSLATAGISAIAYEHEVVKQLDILDDVSAQLRSIRVRNGSLKRKLAKIADEIDDWADRARSTRALFSNLTEEENRETISRYRARAIVGQVIDQLHHLVRGVEFNIDEIDEDLRLPAGRFSEYSAIFQNVILNAVNAMIDKKRRIIQISSDRHGRENILYVQDTGTGIDVDASEEYFRPFVRDTNISEQRKRLGLGGFGLGLTIVRMLASNLNAEVGFIEPDEGFSTAFYFSWSEER